MAHGRSPLGYLQSLRLLVVLLPLLTLVTLGSLGKRYGGSYIDPQSRTELAPIVGPLTLGALLLVILVRLLLPPRSARPLRYLAIVCCYVAATVTSMAGMIYWLAGAPGYWAWATFLLGAVTVGTVSLSRYAYDVSPHRD